MFDDHNQPHPLDPPKPLDPSRSGGLKSTHKEETSFRDVLMEKKKFKPSLCTLPDPKMELDNNNPYPNDTIYLSKEVM